VLKDITFSLEPGGFLAILGPSGSGKTTLLGLLAGLDRPTSGQVFLDGQELGALSEDERARIRGEKVGFVFQAFQLIPTLTAQENVQVPMELRGESGSGPLSVTALGRRTAASRSGPRVQHPSEGAVRG
jgi:putative ABC transport system ATP-binding protein